MDSTQFSEVVELAKRMVMDDICPWTDSQDADSLLKCLHQECNELSEAIQGNMPAEDIASEVGDVLMMILLLSFKLEKNEIVAPEQILNSLTAKLRRRAPPCFQDHTMQSYNLFKGIYFFAPLFSIYLPSPLKCPKAFYMQEPKLPQSLFGNPPFQVYALGLF